MRERDGEEGRERDFKCRNWRVEGSCGMTVTLMRGGRGLKGLYNGAGVRRRHWKQPVRNKTPKAQERWGGHHGGA